MNSNNNYSFIFKNHRIIVSALVIVSLIICLSNTAIAEKNTIETENNEAALSETYASVRKTAKSASEKTGSAKVSFLFALVRTTPKFFSSFIDIYLYGQEVEVLGSEGRYTKIYYKNSNGKQLDAYILTTFLRFNTPAIKANYEHYHIKRGDSVLLTKLFRGQNLKYNVSRGIDCVSVSEGTVIATKTGVATITATNGIDSVSCTIYIFYRWINIYGSGSFVNYDWSTNTNKQTTLYWGPSTDEPRLTLPFGQSLSVHGDDGGNGGWAYVYVMVNGSEKHGFVKIEDISTKNTESFYNSLGWGYPLKNTSYRLLYSPYSPRSSDLHRGIDISDSGISGKAIVAPCDGKVKRAGSDLNASNGSGYYICITSNQIDPVTDNNLIIICQHMNSKSLFTSGEKVKKGDIVGYVGNTGNAQGYHLHFETNNLNAAIGDPGRSDFVNTINPIFLYLDFAFNFNQTCYAANNGYGFYWYNYNN